MLSTSRLLTAAVILGDSSLRQPNSNAATGPEFIRITDRQFSYKRVDVAPQGGARATRRSSTTSLQPEDHSGAIGSAQFLCTFTVGNTRMLHSHGQPAEGGARSHRESSLPPVLRPRNRRGTRSTTTLAAR